MTKGERRKARKVARKAGLPLIGELALDDRGKEPIEFSEYSKGYAARHRWARRYDELNGAPESDYDR